MTYVYILKTKDITAMTTAINEACIVWLHKNCCLVRGIFRRGKWPIFRLLSGILPQSLGFSTKVWGEGALQSTPGRGNKAILKEGNIFGKRGYREYHSRDKPAGDRILKIPLFQNVVCEQNRDGVRQERKGRGLIFWWGWHPTKEGGSKFWAWRGSSTPTPVPLLVENPDPPI